MSVYYSNNMPMRSKFYVTVLLIVYFILCKYYWKIAFKVGKSCFWYQCVRVLYLHAVSRVKKNMLVILVFFRGSPLWSPRLSVILKMPSGTPPCPRGGAEARARRQAPGIRVVIPSKKPGSLILIKSTFVYIRSSNQNWSGTNNLIF